MNSVWNSITQVILMLWICSIICCVQVFTRGTKIFPVLGIAMKFKLSNKYVITYVFYENEYIVQTDKRYIVLLTKMCQMIFHIFVITEKSRFIFCYIHHILKHTNYRRPMQWSLFSSKSQTFGLGQTIWAIKNLGHLGYFWPIYQHPFWYSEFPVHVFH